MTSFARGRILIGMSAVAALGVGIGAARVLGRGESEKVIVAAREGGASSQEGAHFGDGVCASQMEFQRLEVIEPDSSVRPKNTKGAAIAVVRPDPDIYGKGEGTWDAYFAVVDSFVAGAPPGPDGFAPRTGFHPAWVVQENGPNLPPSPKNPSMPPSPTNTSTFQGGIEFDGGFFHRITFVNDATLEGGAGVICIDPPSPEGT